MQSYFYSLTRLALCLSLALPAWCQSSAPELTASPSTEILSDSEAPEATPSSQSEANTETDTSETDAKSEEPDPKPAALTEPKIGGRNISAFTRNLLGNTTVGGYFDMEFTFPVDKNSFFNQRRVILQVSSLLHERLFFNTEIEFEYGAVLGGGSNDGELKVEQAYLDFQLLEGLTFRGGAIMIPVGRLNILHDSDFRDTTVRPLFTSVIVPTTWTEPGAGFYGTLYPDEVWELSYEAYVVQGLRDSLSDGNGLRGARSSLSVDNNNAKAITARLGASPFIGLDFGLGTYLAPFSNDGKKNLGLFVGDFSWTLGPFELLGEGGFAAFDATTQLDSAGTEKPLLGPMWGYYLEAHYHLFPDFLQNSFLSNGFERPVFTLFAQLSQVDTDASQLNANDRTRMVVGLNYRPTTNTAFKLEYQWNIETEALVRNDPSKEIANNQIVASIAAGF